MKDFIILNGSLALGWIVLVVTAVASVFSLFQGFAHMAEIQDPWLIMFRLALALLPITVFLLVIAPNIKRIFATVKQIKADIRGE